MRDYIPATLILCGLIALETCGWLRTLCKQWQYEQMRRQKPIRYPLYGGDGKYVEKEGDRCTFISDRNRDYGLDSTTTAQFSQAAEGGAWRTVRTIGRCVGGLRQNITYRFI